MRKTLLRHYGFDFITDEECLAALAENKVEEKAALVLMEYNYLRELRQKISK